MIRATVRAVASAVAACLAAVVWLALFYGLRPDLVVSFDAETPRLLTGVYPTEVEQASGRTFAWTADRATLRLPGLDRRVPWTLGLRVRGARVQAAENPEIAFAVDGVPLETRPTTTDYSDMAVTIPARADRRGATIQLRISRTFVPGPADPRVLGAVIDDLRLTPAGVVTPPRSSFAGAAVAAAGVAAGVSTLGITGVSAIVTSLLIAGGVSATVARGFAPFTDFPMIAGRTGLAIGLAIAIGAALVRARTRVPLRRAARFAAAFSATALLLKLLVLLHPDMPVGDAMFHAHRFQEVLAGHLYFTSIAPGNYLFPYAPGLYVFAAPFARLVARGAADMALLRITVASMDALAGLLLYYAVVKSRGDRTAGAVATAMYQLMPLTFGVLAVGNLTNAFAQSLAVCALVMMTGASLRLERRGAVALAAAVLTAACLSHTSTFAILPVAILATVVLFWWRGGPALRSPARALLACLCVAVALAIALYYAHFLETYRTQLARIGSETARAAPDAGGRGIWTRVASVPRYLYLYFGLPAMVLAAYGARVLGHRATDRLALSIAGWTLACVAFLVLGVLTPMDFRYYLAAIPIAALSAGLGASAGWSRGGWRRAATVVLLGWALVEGLHGWWVTLK